MKNNENCDHHKRKTKKKNSRSDLPLPSYIFYDALNDTFRGAADRASALNQNQLHRTVLAEGVGTRHEAARAVVGLADEADVIWQRGLNV
jgi:hypothetical protein